MLLKSYKLGSGGKVQSITKLKIDQIKKLNSQSVDPYNLTKGIDLE